MWLHSAGRRTRGRTQLGHQEAEFLSLYMGSGPLPLCVASPPGLSSRVPGLTWQLRACKSKKTVRSSSGLGPELAQHYFYPMSLIKASCKPHPIVKVAGAGENTRACIVKSMVQEPPIKQTIRILSVTSEINLARANLGLKEKAGRGV